MTTLKDVAKAVGCDVSTVSRVLNGRPNRVSGENRSRIREAAHRLGYVANRTASSLASGATRTVGLLIPNVFDGVYAEYIETLDLELSAAGYALRPFICHNRPEKENTALDALLHHEVDAMIAMYHNAERCAAQYEVIRRNGLPLVFRSNVPEVDGVFDCVLLDIDAGYRALAEHLIECGCRKIGVVGRLCCRTAGRKGGSRGGFFPGRAAKSRIAGGLPECGGLRGFAGGGLPGSAGTAEEGAGCVRRPDRPQHQQGVRLLPGGRRRGAVHSGAGEGGDDQ